ncbi:MAG: hypothetical protein KBD37_01100 [Burkholderiales bacterium]|nr:hypothetical protein [Burkholderiales bacterium]
MSTLNNLKEAIKKAIIDTVNNNKDQIINEIANQKRIMFDDNSHEWSPLLPQTVKRKKREKDLFRTPESINIRKGGLFKAFTNSGNYKTTNTGESNNEQIDFDIELSELDQFKIQVTAKHGRDVTSITQSELNQITAKLIQIITQQVKTARESQND